MKKEKIQTLSERDLLLGLIVSNDFCKEIVPILNPRHLQVDYARIISGWIKNYYNDFGKAPGQDITKLYRSHCNELNDESLQENILTFIDTQDF